MSSGVKCSKKEKASVGGFQGQGLCTPMGQGPGETPEHPPAAPHFSTEVTAPRFRGCTLTSPSWWFQSPHLTPKPGVFIQGKADAGSPKPGHVCSKIKSLILSPSTPSSGGWSLNNKPWEKLGPLARPANFVFPIEVFYSRGVLTRKVDPRTPKILHPVHSS